MFSIACRIMQVYFVWSTVEMICVLLIMRALPCSSGSFERFGLEVRHIQASGAYAVFSPTTENDMENDRAM